MKDIVAVAAFLLILAASELAARWWLRNRSRYYVWPPGLRLHQQLDPRVFPEGGTARLYSNSSGERGDDSSDVEDIFRVLVVGSSAAECYFLDQDDTWPALLQRGLNDPTLLQVLGKRKAEVANAARSSVDSAALAMMMPRVLARKRKPDLIIIMQGAADIVLWLKAGAPEHFDPEPPVGKYFAWHPEGAYGFGKFAFVELLRRLYYLLGKTQRTKANAGSWIARGRTMRADAKVIRDTTPDPDLVLARFASNLHHAIQIAKQNSSGVMVLKQPWYERSEYSQEESRRFWIGGVGDVLKDNPTEYFSLECIRNLLVQINIASERVCAEMDVRTVNLLPHLAQENDFYDFLHFTKTGSAVVAELVAEAVVAGSSTSREITSHSPELMARSSAKI